MLAYSSNAKLFYLTHTYDLIGCYHSGPEWTWEGWQWRGTPHSPKLQQYTIRLFSVISRTLVRRVLPPTLQICSRSIPRPHQTGSEEKCFANSFPQHSLLSIYSKILSVSLYIYIYIYIGVTVSQVSIPASGIKPV